MSISARERIFVALDTPDVAMAIALASRLRGLVGGFKVGLEICTAVGAPQVVRALADVGGSVFLDLKLHDIPNTVAGAVRAVCALGPAVRMLTLHCTGGSAMLRAAVAAAQAMPQRPLLLGVTVLTSLDAAALSGELQVVPSVTEYVVHLARMAQACGLDGVVASPHEVGAIRAACPDMRIITPGIRPQWAAEGDQRRVMTPADALRAGADYLVIGRPITNPPPIIGDPVAAIDRLLAEIEQASTMQ
ncbi:MAG: orotidine 5'-phosphate decarboxylase [Pirellulaceae bacterium]|uniref:orotidine-5'-phosphate decarboxylase n=1 Tax=Chloroflexus sp. TaxID=1904827 RepID=UPI0021DBE945|nr:orotidine-5'-phosphate decarboxylase [Chloroflexus sp.]GIV89637.1 MAG: orotidine 5'-phosphate decarboxylase [Chloroflexus sp.]GIW91686.1 MAG: orotidine 5'-phosphate decarboxylase [Pirellulaceae bacterium]GIW91698.1 MAG: orotidine 5'-phosphate decarboxylase [Pirellulaceae bacterium]